MKNHFKTLTTFCFSVTLSLISFCGNAQSSADFLPENTFLAFSVNGQNLQNKMSLESFQNLDFYKELRKELEREGMSGNMSDIGIDWAKELMIFAVAEGDYMTGGMILPISGDNLVKLMSLRETEEQNGITFQQRSREFIGFTDSYLIFLETETTAPYPGWEATEEDYAAYDKIREEAKAYTKNFGLNLFKTKSSPLSKSKNFISSYNKNADANMYLSVNSELANQYMNVTGMAGAFLMGSTGSTNPLAELTAGDQYWSSQLFFDEDQITVESEFFPNEKNMKIQKELSKSKLNSKLLNYVSQDDLLGIYNVNLNSEAALMQTPEYFSPLLNSMLPIDEAGRKIASLITSFIDEESIAEMVNGNLIVAVSNLSIKETEFISYNYDDDFNMTESLEKGSELIPDILGMMQSSNSENLNHILELASIESPLTQKENYFIIPASEGPNFAVYLFTTEDGLFFTNNKEQMQLVMSGKGYQNIDKELAKDMKKNTQTLFVNTNMIFSSIPTAVDNQKFEDKALVYLRDNTSSMTISQEKPKGKSVKQSMIIDIPEKGHENSLQYLFNMINDIYKIAEN
ncbi:MAG: hypothetical protein AB8B53_03140 [Flavobacteriales bacterium]